MSNNSGEMSRTAVKAVSRIVTALRDADDIPEDTVDEAADFAAETIATAVKVEQSDDDVAKKRMMNVIESLDQMRILVEDGSGAVDVDAIEWPIEPDED